MRIVLLGQREIFSNIALGLVVDALAGHELSLFLSGPLAGGKAVSPALEELERIEHAGCADLARTPADSPFLDFDRLAAKTGRPLGLLAHPNTAEGLALLEDLRPDLVISVRYRKILKEAAISIPRYGVLNLHSGLLPQYRGAMATFWAMLNHDAEIGSTLHYIVDGTIDTGPIVGRAAIPLTQNRSYLANVLDLYPSGCALVTRAVATIARHGAAPSTAQAGAGHYYSFPQATDFERFFGRGYRLCDGDELTRFIAAHDPASDPSVPRA